MRSWIGTPPSHTERDMQGEAWLNEIAREATTTTAKADANETTAGNNATAITALESPTSTAPPFAAGWANLGAPFSDLRAQKTSNGRVHLNGLVRRTGATIVAGTSVLLCTLPAGYRPDVRMLHPVLLRSGANQQIAGRADILTDGSLSVQSNNTIDLTQGWVSLDGVSFQS